MVVASKLPESGTAGNGITDTVIEVIEPEVIDVPFDNSEVAVGIFKLSGPERELVPKAVVMFGEAVALSSSSEVEVTSIVLPATVLGCVMFRVAGDEVKGTETEIVGPTKPKFKVSFIETEEPVETAELPELESKDRIGEADGKVVFKGAGVLNLSIDVGLTPIVPNSVLFGAAEDKVEDTNADTVGPAVGLAKLKVIVSFNGADDLVRTIGLSDPKAEDVTAVAESVVRSKEAVGLASGMNVDDPVVIAVCV